MTDEQIIKALKICTSEDLGCQDGCPYISGGCVSEIKKHVLDLINRQKAEIEKLTVNKNAFGLGMVREKERAAKARTEAIKEFAERLKNLIGIVISVEELDTLYMFNIIDIVAKEMVGDS